jgi:SAM-dependent methyltransferase
VSNKQKEWDDVLFVKYPQLYLPFLEEAKQRAAPEVTGITKILNKYNVQKDATILDFSCGIGRHSVLLSLKGYNVVGYDPSPFFIERAEQWAMEKISRPERRPAFYSGNIKDMLTLLNNNFNFDAIILMDTCFGFKGQEEDMKILNTLNNLAKKDGIFIMETEDRDWRLRNFEHITTSRNDSIEMYDKWKFNFETSTSESTTKFYKYNGKNKRSLLNLNTKLRLYSLHELIHMLKIAGWKYKESYNNICTLKKFNSLELNIVTVSQKID